MAWARPQPVWSISISIRMSSGSFHTRWRHTCLGSMSSNNAVTLHSEDTRSPITWTAQRAQWPLATTLAEELVREAGLDASIMVLWGGFMLHQTDVTSGKNGATSNCSATPERPSNRLNWSCDCGWDDGRVRSKISGVCSHNYL